MKWWAFKPDTENPAHVSIETFYSHSKNIFDKRGLDCC